MPSATHLLNSQFLQMRYKSHYLPKQEKKKFFADAYPMPCTQLHLVKAQQLRMDLFYTENGQGRKSKC